jgi:hypothetical protein
VTAVVVPSLAADVESAPSKDPGEEFAKSAGCDRSRADVPMNVSFFSQHAWPGQAAVGPSTVAEAALDVAPDAYSPATVVEAAQEAAAGSGSDSIVVRLDGASIDIVRVPDGMFVAVGLVECA